MTRLASIAKAGFYPTPDRVTDWIAQNVLPSANGGKLLDPCCGEGVAAHTVATAWNLESYGIEIDAQRAKLAAGLLHRVLRMDYQVVRAPLRAFQALFLNPPYDSVAPSTNTQGGNGATLAPSKRVEYQFLRDLTKFLQPGGLLVYLVPQPRVDVRMASFLAAAYDQVAAYRFPDPEYAAFKQVVIFGVAKAEARKDDPAGLALAHACQGTLPVLPESGLGYTIPNADPSARFFFHGSEINPADALAEAQTVGVWNSDEWRDWLNPDQGQLAAFQPLVPFKKGHLASVIAAGLMQNLRLSKGAKDLLVKGYTVKVQEEIPQADDDEDAPSDKHTKTVIRDRFVTEVVVLDLKTGDATRIADPTEFAAFVEKWRDTLTAKVMSEFQPLYNFDLAAEGADVNALLDRLSKGRLVAGRQETGLFEAQKHTAVALRKRLQRAGYALCVGEPGVGKTTIATTVAELFREIDGDTRPTLVMCPPHLVPKWIREIQEIVPGAQAFSLRRLTDVTEFVAKVKANPDTPMFAVLSREMAKLGSGWQPAYAIRKVHQRVQPAPGKKKVVVTEAVFACPDCGHFVSEVEGDNETAQVTSATYFERRKRKCFACGAPLYQTSARNGNTPRFPLAEYIAKKLPGFFGLLAADEAHQMKGQSTDQGYAFGALIRACARTLALTGTIYGGKSTSLFYLLHRLSPKIRSEFKWNDGQKWAERFGILERVTTESESDNGYGHYSGKRRTNTYVREMPGVSPELVTQLLDATVFVNLQDLGFPLPGYVEIPHEIEMSAEMREAYDALERDFTQRARQAWQDGDHSMIGQFVQALLGYPNRCFHTETITDMAGQVVASAPALDASRLYPKEAWLIDEVLAQRDRERKTIVFCRQTGTRDITARLADQLEQAGLRVAVLKASVDTSKREAWLKEQATQVDALIVNPKIVDTGLDLVDFQSIVWLESEYSLYVLMQATKRIYRVGQTNDVEIHFPVYQDSMEHRATALAGQKWAAAQLLYGDSVEGALTQAVDTGSFLAELTKSMIAKARVVDLSTLFRQSQVLSRVSVPAQKQTQRVHPEQGRRTPALLPPPTAIPIVLPTGALVQLSMF